ncbi:hypothetical protein [Absidia glauca]|uniref:Rho-GAP domain-containing protein n=1 Tax=Absidia glauca TaxID=4829 RepID=A0A168MAP0_ABSGL|nr:hypothetical protein [Absidia glauca]
MPSPFSDSSSITSVTSTSSTSTSSSAFSFDGAEVNHGSSSNSNNNNNNASSVLSKLAGTVRDTRTMVEQKKLELNASMQERLPEWRSRGVMYGNRARETSMEWSRKGKEAVDRWKKDRVDRSIDLGETHSVFGQPLETAVLYTKLTEHDHIPVVVRRCINYLDEHGIHEVGIYRIPGSTLAVNKLRSTFDSGYDCDFYATLPDPNVVATLLKMYLRELPAPIIPQEVGQEYKQHISRFIGQQHGNEDHDHITADLFDMPKTDKLPPITPDLLDAIRTTTTKLPPINLYLLNVLCQHLRRIANHANENKMTTSNLALIFIPTLNIGRLLFHCMVDHYSKVFGDVPEVTSLPTMPAIPTCLSVSSPSSTPASASTSSSSITSVSAGPMQPCPQKPLPPPLPHKPKHITIPKPPRRQNKSLDLGRIHRHARSEHTKTLSDTDVTSMITPPLPPPKPQRSPIAKPVVEYFKPNVDRLAENKPRSRSVSSTHPPPLPPSIKSSAIRNRSGSRVEAIGRQFEQIMSKTSSLSPSSSISSASPSSFAN